MGAWKGPWLYNMKIRSLFCVLCLWALSAFALAADFGWYRLLSVSDSEKLILVSQSSTKTKFLLDAASAKITINGKPAEFRELGDFSDIQLKMNHKKLSRNGITIDGTATEIRVPNTATNSK
jgi:hypothetical protein